ncbi:MAG: tRNA preQ1(34) S-adenosylmethionine ribosyltransferase-isomerase QueA [Candidatus Saccharimonadaceae bacterium]|nr:tRNA preQ1(34) S-adenosylmethionine ribosyltransferase-isomerase QueA [Candidatus Saccharimonadaceae bacterium]
MKLSDYNYDLPENLIANKPPEIRGTTKLLVVNRSNGNLLDKKYSDLTEFLEPGDTLVMNDTKVIKARLKAIKENGAIRELVVLEKHSYDNNWYRHRVLYRKKLRVGDKLKVGDANLTVEEIQAGGLAIIKSSRDFLDIVEQYGEVPLPPYMHRKAEPLDVERYQTIWANEKGSVAAPTASLNMTEDLLTKLRKKGIKVVYITLHVGLGTFLPIRTDNVEDHRMHQEYFEIPSDTINAILSTKANSGRVVALGTTVARALEYSYKSIKEGQTDISGEADIFIYPGYDFKVIDGLLTNFHAPKSTVLMLTAAFAGWDKLLQAYNHATKEQYHFLSYGDSMLIL